MQSFISSSHASPLLFLLLRWLLLLPFVGASSDQPVVVTTSGTLQGVLSSKPTGTVAKFLGVPYALPPVDGLRFRPPQPMAPEAVWSVRSAEQYGASCMQDGIKYELMYPQLWGTRPAKVSEDCLFLNVFVPAQAQEETEDQYLRADQQDRKRHFKHSKKPVMVWLAGEGFGYASSDQFDGSRLALSEDVIVVTVNYRVSVFGFLSTGSASNGGVAGNMGLLDQAEALHWVRRNAAAFGGDPERVTVFGRFTGAMSISALLTSPLSTHDGKPLFHRAILQSGVAGGTWTFDPYPMTGVRQVAEAVDCDPASDIGRTIECLQKVPAEQLLAASRSYSWRMVLDEQTLPDEPLNTVARGKHLDIPVMLGSTSDEGFLCLLTHLATNSSYLPAILSDDVSEDDFRSLVRDFFQGYLGTRDSRLEADLRYHYSQDSPKSTWRSRYLNLCGDGYVRAKTLGLAKQLSHSHHGSPVFLYEFKHRPSFSIRHDFVNAAHGDDVLFSLGLVKDDQNWTPDELALSKAMTTAWANFAKKGDPNPMLGSKTEWPTFSRRWQHYWEFSTEQGVKRLKHDWRLRLWLNKHVRHAQSDVLSKSSDFKKWK